jgi:hypothetical protein
MNFDYFFDVVHIIQTEFQGGNPSSRKSKYFLGETLSRKRSVKSFRNGFRVLEHTWHYNFGWRYCPHSRLKSEKAMISVSLQNTNSSKLYFSSLPHFDFVLRREEGIQIFKNDDNVTFWNLITGWGWTASRSSWPLLLYAFILTLVWTNVEYCMLSGSRFGSKYTYVRSCVRAKSCHGGAGAEKSIQECLKSESRHNFR